MITWNEYRGKDDWSLRERLALIEEGHKKWIDQGELSEWSPGFRASPNERYFRNLDYTEARNALLKLMSEHQADAILVAETLEPYSVLKLKRGASAKQISEAHRKMSQKLSGSIVQLRAAIQDLKANTDRIDGKIVTERYTEHLLIQAEDQLDLVEKAYATLSAQKPYNPNSFWEQLKAFFSGFLAYSWS